MGKRGQGTPGLLCPKTEEEWLAMMSQVTMMNMMIMMLAMMSQVRTKCHPTVTDGVVVMMMMVVVLLVVVVGVKKNYPDSTSGGGHLLRLGRAVCGNKGVTIYFKLEVAIFFDDP